MVAIREGVKAEKHKEQDDIQLAHPSKGMNIAAPAAMLPQEQCLLLENMYFDYSSGLIRTRWPFRKHSTSILSPEPVTGIYYWNGYLYFTSGSSLYYLNASAEAVYVGAIGPNPPSFHGYNSVLLIASGRKLQQMTTGNVLSDVTNAPLTSGCILGQQGWIWVCGDTQYPDMVARNDTTGNLTDWGDVFAYLGYKDDDLSVVAINDGPGEYIVAFKKGTSKKLTAFYDPGHENISGTPDPKFIQSSNIEAAHTMRGSFYLDNKLWIMDSFCPMAIAGTDAYDKLVIEKESMEIGSRIAPRWDPTDYGFCVANPKHAQLWFIPDPSTQDIWVLHYNVGAWVRFNAPTGLTFYSGYYLPSTRQLFLGGSDGNIYIYQTSGIGLYQDNPGGVDVNIKQRYFSRTFDYFPMEEHIIKGPIHLSYRTLKAGAGTLTLYKNYGASVASPDYDHVALTFSSSSPTLYDYRAKRLYESRSELLYASSIRRTEIDYNCEVDNLTVHLEITSGAIEIRSFAMTIAKGINKQSV